jgi:hypothetical protein
VWFIHLFTDSGLTIPSQHYCLRSKTHLQQIVSASQRDWFRQFGNSLLPVEKQG